MPVDEKTLSTKDYVVLSVVSLVILVPLIAIIYLSIQRGSFTKKPTFSKTQDQNTVQIVAGKQLINLVAKAGYWPKTVNAQAGLETNLDIQTLNTFDCSSSISIPELGVQETLAPTGTTRIALGTQPAGKTINGTCSMGMYDFQILFE
jgi:plastocyanin domain-containing protein